MKKRTERATIADFTGQSSDSIVSARHLDSTLVFLATNQFTAHTDPGRKAQDELHRRFMMEHGDWS